VVVIRGEVAEILNLPQPAGYLVNTVARGSPAWHARFRAPARGMLRKARSPRGTRATRVIPMANRPCAMAGTHVEDAMIGTRRTALVIALCAALAASTAYATDNPFVGRWHWSPTQSTLPPGATAPRDVVSEISQDGAAVSWSVTVTMPDDQRHVMTFKAGAEPARVGGDTTASAVLDADTLKTTFSGDAGQSDTLTCKISANHNQMTCDGVLNDGKGHSVSYVDVYDRM
jgi:hypothetical protein